MTVDVAIDAKLLSGPILADQEPAYRIRWSHAEPRPEISAQFAPRNQAMLPG